MNNRNNLNSNDEEFKSLLSSLKLLKNVDAPAGFESDLMRRINHEKFADNEEKSKISSIFTKVGFFYSSIAITVACFIVFMVVISNRKTNENQIQEIAKSDKPIVKEQKNEQPKNDIAAVLTPVQTNPENTPVSQASVISITTESVEPVAASAYYSLGATASSKVEPENSFTSDATIPTQKESDFESVSESKRADSFAPKTSKSFNVNAKTRAKDTTKKGLKSKQIKDSSKIVLKDSVNNAKRTTDSLKK